MYQIIFDVNKECLVDGCDPELKAVLSKYEVSLEVLDPHGPGGGNPEVAFRCADRNKLIQFSRELFESQFLPQYIEEITIN